MPRPRWAIRTAQVAAVCVALAIALALLIHAAPVRRAALRRAVTLLAERFNVGLRADTLTYNLFALRVTLTGVEVASTRTPETPFLTADRLEVVLPTSALLGPFSIEHIGLDNARLTIQRDADGTSNLPETAADPGEPQAILIDRLRIPQLAVTVTDAAQALVVSLPALDVDVGAADGTVRLTRPGRIAQGDVAITLSTLGGGVAFDGRSVAITQFRATTPEANVQADGTIALLVEEPHADLRFTGGGDLARILRLLPDAPPVSGMFAVDGTVKGPLARPDAAVRIRSDALQWDRLVLADVDASLLADGERVDVSRFAGRIAGGAVSGTGGIATATGSADLMVSWSDLDLDALMRAFRLDDVRPAASATGTASVRGAGSDLRAWTIDARTRLAPRARARGQVAVAGDAELRTADGRWALDLDGIVERVPVHAMVGGRVDGRTPAASTISGTVSAVGADLPAVLASLRDAGLVETDPDLITAGRVDADAVVTGSLNAPRMQITAAASGLTGSNFSNLSADVTAAGTVQQMAIEARVRQQAANEIVATGIVWPDAARADLRVTGTIDDWRTLLPDLPLAGAAALDLHVHGPVAAIAAQGNVTITDAAYGNVAIGRVLAAIEADAMKVAVDASSAELSARARLNLSLASDRRADIEVMLDDADLARLTRDVDAPLPVTGRLSLTARAAGALDDWRRGTADVDLTRLDAKVGELPVRLAAPARATYADRTVDVASLEAQVGETRLSVAGRIPLDGSAAAVAAADALRAVLVGDIEHVLAAVHATGLTTLPDVSARGPVALLARVGGSIERPSVSADLEVGGSEIAVGELPPVRVDELRATLANGWIERLTASGRWQESRVSVDARAPLRLFREYLPAGVIDAFPAASGPATLNARAESITSAVLAPFVAPGTLAQIDGVVDASARLEADALDPAAVRGEVRLDRLDIRVAGLPVTQREPTRIAVDNGVARVVSWDWTGQGASLNVQGEIGLTNQQAALLGAGVVDLRLLAPFVRTAGVNLAGTVAPRFSVSGSLANPRIDGEAVLTDAEIRLAEPRVIATDVDAFVVLSPEQARITMLTGVVNGGTLTGSGDAHYGPGVSPSARLTANITGMGLEFPDGLRSELNADLTIALAQQGESAAGSVTGTVTVVRSAYRETLAVAAGLLTAFRTEQIVAAQAEPDAFASNLTLDVRVVTDADIIVDNNLARLQLGGDLRVIGTAAAPSVAGRAVLREGGQLFLGQNVYTLESGTVDFADPTAIVPELNVVATTRAGGYDIELGITGTPEDLEVALSTPDADLGQADITSLLLTGRVFDDVAGAEADIVREQVVGYLSGDVLALAGRVVGLDTIRLGGPDTSTLRRDPAAVAAEADPTSRLTFGKLIHDDVELTYSQSLRDGDAQTWIVDYRPITQVNIRFVSDDDDLRAYEFRHDVSLGGSRVERQTSSERSSRVEKVVAVTVTVDRGVPEAALREALRVNEGDTFDFAEWQRDRERLEELLHRQGRLEARVTARRLDRESGVALVYDIAAGPLTSVSVTGHSLSSQERASIEEAWTQSIFDDFLREEAEGIVRAALADAGYLEPRITSTVQTGDAKTLQIVVEAGARTAQRRIVIEAAGDDDLEDDLEAWVRQRGLAASWNAPEDLQKALVTELRARGHLAAQVAIGTPRTESGVAVLPVNVDGGPIFVVGDITFSGAARIAEDRLREQAALTPGAAYVPAEVEAARRRVDTTYRRDGFLTTRVTAQPAVDRSTERVNIGFTIQEGPQQVLRDVDVRGNRGIDTGVITRAIDLDPGEPVGADAWLQARARLFETGLFRRVDVTAEPLEATSDGRERPTRLTVVVEEWPALRIRYGVMVSEERPADSVEGRDLTPGLSADVTRRTLFGRAIGIGAAAEYQRRERLARVFMSAPTLFGRRIESLLTIERSHREFADASFVTDTSGVAWEQRVRPRRALQLSYAYRFDQDHTFDTEASDDPFFPSFDVNVNIARLTGSAVFDTRDDPTETRRGWLLSGNVELSPQALGSDVSFVRELGQAYYFHPWGPVVFASAGRFGVVTPLEGQEVLPSELFYAGGARTVRGVAQDALGPHDFLGDPVGGRALLVMNQEVRFPIIGWLRGVGFIDMGNVFREPRDIDFKSLDKSFGAGLRLNTPFGLFRIDYGRLWWNPDDLQPSRWTFGIGHAF